MSLQVDKKEKFVRGLINEKLPSEFSRDAAFLTYLWIGEKLHFRPKRHSRFVAASTVMNILLSGLLLKREVQHMGVSFDVEAYYKSALTRLHPKPLGRPGGRKHW